MFEFSFCSQDGVTVYDFLSQKSIANLRFGAGRARSDVFDGPAWRGFSEVKRTFGFCFRCSILEVKQISPAAPHHRKVFAPRPPLRSRHNQYLILLRLPATSSSFHPTPPIHHSHTPSLTHSLTSPIIFRIEFSFFRQLSQHPKITTILTPSRGLGSTSSSQFYRNSSPSLTYSLCTCIMDYPRRILHRHSPTFLWRFSCISCLSWLIPFLKPPARTLAHL